MTSYSDAGKAGKTHAFWKMQDWSVDQIEGYLLATARVPFVQDYRTDTHLNFFIGLARYTNQHEIEKKLNEIKIRWTLKSPKAIQWVDSKTGRLTYHIPE